MRRRRSVVRHAMLHLPRQRQSNRRRCRPRQCRSSEFGPEALSHSRRPAPCPSSAHGPSEITPAFAVVPPMSKAMALAISASRQTALRGDHAGGRARIPECARIASRLLEPEQSAGRLHHQKCAGKSGRSQMASIPGQIVPQHADRYRHSPPRSMNRSNSRYSCDKLVRCGYEDARQTTPAECAWRATHGRDCDNNAETARRRLRSFPPQLFGDGRNFASSSGFSTSPSPERAHPPRNGGRAGSAVGAS